MTYEQWLINWAPLKSNYLPTNEEPTEKDLRKWYWDEVGQYRPRKVIK